MVFYSSTPQKQIAKCAGDTLRYLFSKENLARFPTSHLTVCFSINYVPPRFGEVNLTPEEQEELRKREERKVRLHQNYLRHKANGKVAIDYERTKAKKKAAIDAKKNALRTEENRAQDSGKNGLIIRSMTENVKRIPQ